MDINGVEQVNVAALGGADTLTVNDLSGTDVAQVNLDLAGTPGSGTGDGQADTVIVNGTNGADNVQVVDAAPASPYPACPPPWRSAARRVPTTNWSSTLSAETTHSTPSNLPAGVVRLTVDAGAGNDQIVGGQGADVLIGGDGNDSVNGGHGDDVAFLGAGDDIFVWNPGDGSDAVEGQAGHDTMSFNGSNANENIDLSANGSRVRLFRDVGNVTMDLNGVERSTSPPWAAPTPSPSTT